MEEIAYRLNAFYVLLTTGLGTAAEMESPRLICRILALLAK
jgi:hypothetical protein